MRMTIADVGVRQLDCGTASNQEMCSYGPSAEVNVICG